jgi:hypothetical protein
MGRGAQGRHNAACATIHSEWHKGVAASAEKASTARGWGRAEA